MISVIIPTMWAAEELLTSISQLTSIPEVREIVIIDNNFPSRPSSITLAHGRVRIISMDCNRGVAHSWNHAIKLVQSDLVCLLNDDILVDSGIFSWVHTSSLVNISVLGMAPDLFDYQGPVSVTECQTRPDGWGQCMFLRREQYIPIPLLHSFFTDDFLFDHVPLYTKLPNYQFSCSVRGRRSVTSHNFQSEFIQDRVYYNKITSLYPRYAYR